MFLFLFNRISVEEEEEENNYCYCSVNIYLFSLTKVPASENSDKHNMFFFYISIYHIYIGTFTLYHLLRSNDLYCNISSHGNDIPKYVFHLKPIV